MKRIQVGVLLALIGAGCSAGGTHECRGNEVVQEPSGAPSDYISEAGEYSGYRLETPAACSVGVRSYWIGVVGTGSRHLGEHLDAGCVPVDASTPDAGATCELVELSTFLDDLEGALDVAGLPAASVSSRAPLGGFPCSPTLPRVRVTVGDWREADRAVSALSQTIASWDLAEAMGILVSGTIAYCE